MATRTVITYADDIDDEVGDDVKTVRFSLDGTDYEIDLNDANAATLRGVLQPFMDAGRRTSGKKASKGYSDALGARRTENSKIRKWALENDYTVGDRGRISDEIRRAYANAIQQVRRTGTDG